MSAPLGSARTRSISQRAFSPSVLRSTRRTWGRMPSSAPRAPRAEAAARATVEGKRRVRDRARDERVLPARFACPPIAQDCRGLRETRDNRAGLRGRDPERPPQAVVAKIGALVEDQESPGAICGIHDSSSFPSKACAVIALAFGRRRDYINDTRTTRRATRG